MTTLPPIAISKNEYKILHSEPASWLPIMSAIADAHDIGGPPPRAAGDGSNLIALLGDDFVIKLFPPFLRHQYESERLALRHLRARLGTPIPETTHDGETQGWPYLVMTQLHGASLTSIWDGCPEDERRAILRAVGGLIAEVQAVPVGPLADLNPEWETLLSDQARQCKNRHERLGLPAHLLAQIEAYLDKTRDSLPVDFQSVILTGEYTPGNLLMSRRRNRWEISGLIDFGDTMVGFREYDLLGPSAFLASGDAGRLRALLEGYGYDGISASGDLSARLMRMLLLHRYSHLGGQVKIAGWQDRVRSLHELERLLWP